MDAIAHPVSFADIEDAAERIKNRVRRTPCLRTRFIREPCATARPCSNSNACK